MSRVRTVSGPRNTWSGLTVGTALRPEFGTTEYRTVELLGEGGQGQVWRVTPSRGAGPDYALKWYFPDTATDEQWQALSRLVEGGAPDARFLWPLELARAPGKEGFGYLMGLRSDTFSSMVDVMRRAVEPNFRTLATAGFELADGFLQLHSRGLCYLDISFGNMFVQPEDGRILICDTDNVRVDGQAASIAGTPKFMAPEVIRDLLANRIPRPNRKTDLFSLSVLLFYMFMMHHPFEGRREAEIACLDADAQNQLYGADPVFIFSPEDQSNRPDPGLHPNPLAFWPIYPQFLRDLFIRAFTMGVDNPDDGRVQESEWRKAMANLRDAITNCSGCGLENFLDPMDPDGREARACWNCGAGLVNQARLTVEGIRGRVVALNADTYLFPHHIEGDRYNFRQPLAVVDRHPHNPEIWGLKNLSTTTWKAIMPDDKRWDVPPGRSVTLTPDVRIEFGSKTGVIGGRVVAAGNLSRTGGSLDHEQ